MIEADVQRYFHVDTSGLWRGELTLRRLRVLIDGLPSDCQTAYALSGVEPGPLRHWSLADALLGRIADELAAYRWQWEAAHLAKRQRHRHRPESVLPKPDRSHASEARSNVVPLVKPSQLSEWMSDVEGSDDRGD